MSKDDYEIICVDDGSTDRTPEILREYAERYPNIRVITKQHGYQFGNGRTMGLEASRGDYVWFVDHDDVLAPNAVDQLKQITQANPDYDRFAFPYYRFYTQFTEEERRMVRDGTLQRCSGLKGKDYYLWSSIIRRDFLLERGIRAPSRHIAEAGKFWGIEPFPVWGGDRAIMNECYENHIRSMQLTGRPLYHYRIHTGQSISDSSPKQVADRELKRRNNILFRAHRAFIQKQRFLQLAETDPPASREALTDAIVRLRDLVIYASGYVPEWAWKDAMERFEEKEIFFRKKPREYRFSLASYLKNFSLLERFRFKTILGYYSFTFTGAKLYYLVSGRNRRKEVRRVEKLAEAAKRE